MPSAEVVGLPPGAVVELDRQADEPIDLYVNGRRFATGRLVVVDGGGLGRAHRDDPATARQEPRQEEVT